MTTQAPHPIALTAANHVDHEFKSHPDVFWPAARGEKTFEFRKDDRGGYQVGQTVRIRCYLPLTEAYVDTPPLDRVITNILRPGEFGLQDGYCILSLRPLNAAAETIMPAEGAGLREAVKPFAAFNDAATFPGSTWSEEPDSADARHITGISAPLTIGMFRAASVALASPQPAVEGPVAAAIRRTPIALASNALRIALSDHDRALADNGARDGLSLERVICKVAQYYGLDGQNSWQEAVNFIAGRCEKFSSKAAQDDEARELARLKDNCELCFSRGEVTLCEGCDQIAKASLATLTPPSDPKPTVPGNDAGMRDHKCPIGLDATPGICSAGTCYVCASERAALTPQTGSAGEDPKTPDAGVGEEAKALCSEVCAWAENGPCPDCTADTEPGWVKDANEALAQPAPVGEDETGVREALRYETDSEGAWVWLVWAISTAGAHLAAITQTEAKAGRYESAVARLYPGARVHIERAPVDHSFGASDLRSVAYRAAMKDARRQDRAPQPPKAETPAGVSEFQQAYAERLHQRMTNTNWSSLCAGGGRDLPGTQFYWLNLAGIASQEFKALSAAPAARPGDEVNDARGVANVFEAMWRDAEDEAARLASGFWPSDAAIAEAFHEHRRVTQPRLPPWSEVMEGSGIWKHSHDFAARLASLSVTASTGEA